MIEDEYEEQKNVRHDVDEPGPSTRTISGPHMTEESLGSVNPWSCRLRDKKQDERGKKKMFEESSGDESFDEEHGLSHLRTPSKWESAMDDEMDALVKNDTWDLVHLPSGKKAIGSKWVYKVKCKSNGSVERYKARLVAKGYEQTKGLDYDETFSPVAKMTTVRLVIAMASMFGWKLGQMNVNNAFFVGNRVAGKHTELGEDEGSSRHTTLSILLSVQWKDK
ncbi:hypothetical protein L7F22_023190 [Adiantum nelumboides]|nr:hypothetical protein [Adiantum nelumboides]